MRARSCRRSAREGREGGARRGPLRGELGYEEEQASGRQKDGKNRYSIWRDKRKICITDADNGHRAEGVIGKPKTLTGAERHCLSRLPKDTIFNFTGRDPQT